jgi:hypothetical protein
MKMRWALLVLSLTVSAVPAQQPMAGASALSAPAVVSGVEADSSMNLFPEGGSSSSGGAFSGNHNFRNFIGFVSNPLQSIDPRAVTAVYPLFGSAWVDTRAPFPDGNFQLYGPAMTVALSERLAVGINQGGYAHASFSRDQLNLLRRRDPLGRFLNVERGGSRDGWLNIGGFAQYTLIEDVDNQFLLTAGVRLEVPSGSHEIFQGHGPAEMAPYVTAGKEFGEFHVLATGGYQFPIGPGSDNTREAYLNLHLDRRVFCWLYPLVELNALYHSNNVSFGLQTRRGDINFGNFESEGNVLTLAVGANAVLIPERLEIGAVYTKPIATQHSFEADGVLVKMVLRF